MSYNQSMGKHIYKKMNKRNKKGASVCTMARSCGLITKIAQSFPKVLVHVATYRKKKKQWSCGLMKFSWVWYPKPIVILRAPSGHKSQGMGDDPTPSNGANTCLLILLGASSFPFGLLSVATHLNFW